MEYYKQGRVGTLEQKGNYVTSTVRGTEAYYVAFRELGQTRYGCSCTCPRFDEVGQCKHIAAAMIAYAQGQTEKQVRTDFYARRMLETYLQKSSRDYERQMPVHLVPRLLLDNQFQGEYPAFGFRVGYEKLYVVKDIRTFLENVRDGKTTNYGKSLTLNHSLEGFDPQSQEIIQLLMNEFPEFKTLQRSYHYYGNSGPMGYAKNSITLYGDAFDQMFDLLGQEPVECADGTSVFLSEEDPQVSLSLERDKDCVWLQVDTEDLHFFGSPKHLYAQSLHTITRCSDTFRQKIYPLLQDEQEQMRLSPQDVPTFCSCVLPAIQDAVTIQDPEAVLQEYLPEECTPCFYFDMEDDILTLKLTFRYGDTEIPEDVPAAKTPDRKRNVVAEQQAVRLAEAYFQKEKGRYIQEDEEQIFDFMTANLDRFHEAGEVFVTDRLSHRRIGPTGAGMDVSVSDGLLTLDISTGEFPAEELEDLYQSLLKRRRYHRLKDGRYLELDGSPFEKLAEMTHMLQIAPKDLKKGNVTMPAFRGLYLDSLLSGSEGLTVRRDQNFRAMVRSFKAVSESDYVLPEHLEGVLRPYQRIGFQWLKTLESSGFGGILADEMGLGKTVQVIAYLTTLDRRKNPGPSLVVCPASLILNWGEELRRFGPELNAALLMGNAAERKSMMETCWDADVWVTSYELLRQDIAAYGGKEFYCCILDEGQHIKNRTTQVSKAVKQLVCRQRFVLTGTPIENRLSELWNLFDFLMPGYLFSHGTFVEKLEKPMIKSKSEEAGEQLKRLVQPFMLRRLKKDVLKELPPKIEYTRLVPLSETERKTYLSAVYAAKTNLGDSKLQILAALTQLRQVCCDPNLCFENYQGPTSKLEACLELCAGMVENGHQILLFSQFTSMLDRIRPRLEELGISSFTLQGSTPKKKRAELVKSFNAGGASVFLISLKAGGTGLNLTAADVVIHYDPWWNLAAQNQATDRAHRIGQSAHVQVYKLIAKDTIEEKILELQEKKWSLMDAVSGTAEGSILDMTKEELLKLLD
jgi:superfamily II DNA or RNA helicase